MNIFLQVVEKRKKIEIVGINKDQIHTKREQNEIKTKTERKKRTNNGIVIREIE